MAAERQAPSRESRKTKTAALDESRAAGRAFRAGSSVQWAAQRGGDLVELLGEGLVVGAASVVNGRLRRLRLHRLIDRDLAGLPALPKGGIADTFRDVMSVLRGAR